MFSVLLRPTPGIQLTLHMMPSHHRRRKFSQSIMKLSQLLIHIRHSKLNMKRCFTAQTLLIMHATYHQRRTGTKSTCTFLCLIWKSTSMPQLDAFNSGPFLLGGNIKPKNGEAEKGIGPIKKGQNSKAHPIPHKNPKKIPPDPKRL